MNFAGVFKEGSNGIGSRWKREVIELDGAIGDGSNKEGVVGLRPGYVVDTISSVESSKLRDSVRGIWGEVEDVQTTIAKDAEVLGSGDGQATFVEWAELHGVAVEWGFEQWHGFWDFRFGDFALLDFVDLFNVS